MGLQIIVLKIEFMIKIPKFIALENIIKSRLCEFNYFIKAFKKKIKNQNHLKNRKTSFNNYKNNYRRKKYLKIFLNRKIRRKKITLKKIQNRLNQNPKLLSSHIWHSKRFRMLNQWGWKIPFSKNTSKMSTNQKILQRNMIQDISFFAILKLSGAKV